MKKILFSFLSFFFSAIASKTKSLLNSFRIESVSWHNPLLNNVDKAFFLFVLFVLFLAKESAGGSDGVALAGGDSNLGITCHKLKLAHYVFPLHCPSRLRHYTTFSPLLSAAPLHYAVPLHCLSHYIIPLHHDVTLHCSRTLLSYTTLCWPITLCCPTKTMLLHHTTLLHYTQVCWSTT